MAATGGGGTSYLTPVTVSARRAGLRDDLKMNFVVLTLR
jgi:hypothetical protein